MKSPNCFQPRPLLLRVLQWLCVALCTPLWTQASAQPLQLEAGVHYQRLATPLADSDPERINVVELFWYGCATCYDLLPTLQIWEASYRSSDVTFTRLPVSWSPIMQTHARLYLTADALGLVPAANKSSWEVTPTFHNTLFDTVQRDDNPLRSAAAAAEIFAGAGITREAFDGAWNSAAVTAKVAELDLLPGRDAIARLPALLVDGLYVLTLNQRVPTSDDLFKVLSQLVVDIRETKRNAGRLDGNAASAARN